MTRDPALLGRVDELLAEFEELLAEAETGAAPPDPGETLLFFIDRLPNIVAGFRMLRECLEDEEPAEVEAGS